MNKLPVYPNNNLSKASFSSDLLAESSSPRFVEWNGNTINTPFKAGLTDCQEGFAFCYGNWNNYMTVIAFAKNSNKMWAWSKASGNWIEYATKSELTSAISERVKITWNSSPDGLLLTVDGNTKLLIPLSSMTPLT